MIRHSRCVNFDRRRKNWTNISEIPGNIATIKDTQRSLKIQVARCSSSIAEHDQALAQHERKFEQGEFELVISPLVSLR